MLLGGNNYLFPEKSYSSLPLHKGNIKLIIRANLGIMGKSYYENFYDLSVTFFEKKE